MPGRWHLPPGPRPCQHCAREFTPQHGNTRYCSDECRAATKRATGRTRRLSDMYATTRLPRACARGNCSATFIPEHGNVKYCTEECRALALRHRRRKDGPAGHWQHSMRRRIGEARYQSMVDEQHGLCAICQQPETAISMFGDTKSLAVDHCHGTGAIRGLLCQACNTALGGFKDDPRLLMAAVAYLSRHASQAVVLLAS